MIAPTILAPTTLPELDSALVTHADARLVGGGTLEVPRWTRCPPRWAIHLGALPEMRVRGAGICGGGLTVAEIAAEPAFPSLLRDLAAVCATPPIRALATLGGNIAAARPGCLVTALLALDATVEAYRPGRGRYSAPAGVLAGSIAPGVVLGATWHADGRRTAFRRLTRQAGGGPVLATVAASVRPAARGAAWRIAVAGTGLRPHRLLAAESLLTTTDADADADAAMLAAAAAAEIGDRSSADPDHLRQVVGILVRRAVGELQEGRTT